MPSRFHLLLAATLLVTSLGSCSKKEDVLPAEVKNVASYTYDGHMVSCVATQKTTSSPATSSDNLVVTMTTTPQPSSGPEYLTLTFQRPSGQPATTYLLVSNGAVLYNTANPQGVAFQYNIITRTVTESGSISGTFSSEARTQVPGGTYTVDHTLRSGTFTDVRP